MLRRWDVDADLDAVRRDVRRSRGDALHRRRLDARPAPSAPSNSTRSSRRGTSAASGSSRSSSTATGELIGFAGLAIPDFLPEIMPAVEIGWRLARAHWGHGYATEAARAALAFGFERVELDRVVQRAHGRQRRVGQRRCARSACTSTARRRIPATAARVRVYAIDRPAHALTGDDRAAGRGRRADRVEHPHLASAVGERRHRHGRVGRPALDAGAQRLARAACTGRARGACSAAADRRARRARRAARDRRARRARGARRGPSSNTPSAVDLDRAVGAGDDRHARRRRGVHDAAVCCSTTSAPLAHRDPHDERVLGARSRRATVGSAALTDAISPNQVRTWSTMCEPDAPSQPPPRAGVEPPLGHAARRDRRRAARTARASNVRGSPIAPVGDRARATSARSGAQRNSWPTSAVTPAALGRARASRSASAASSANGFSQITCRPASHASIASAACVSGGVAIVTASTPGERERVGERRARVRRRRAARRGARVRSASRPTSATHVEAGVAQRGHVHPARRSRCRRPPRRGTR